MTTYTDILTRHNVTLPPHLEAQAAVPVLTGTQRQGDVLIVPTRPATPKGNQVPAEGVPVVRGENNGNTHLLVTDGPATWHPTPTANLTLGTVTIPAGSTGYLLHPEHGANGIAPGSYRISRQREMRDEIRRVAD